MNSKRKQDIVTVVDAGFGVKRLNYYICLFRLSLIVLFAEMIVMIVFDVLGLERNLSGFSRALLDGILLLLLSAYPVYLWVFLPIVRLFLNDQREIEMLAEALQGAGDSVLITSPDGTIIYVNQAFSDVTGFSAYDALGKTPKILSSGKQDAFFYQRMWKSILDTGAWQGELWNKRKNGELYPEALNIRAIYNEQKEIRFFVGVFSDLTEKKSIEHALLQSQKQEAVGTLVGGVAHNFNNLLAAISGKAFLAGESKDEQQIKTLIQEIQDLSFESAQLIRQLLSFSREAEHDKQPIAIGDVVKEAVETARLGIPEDIHLLLRIEDEDSMILGDRVHIKQAMLNILNNARDALAASEKKEIRVELCKIKREKCEFATTCKNYCNEVIQVKVIDSGVGIAKEQIDRIFDPFFTTKEVDKGTGLGLSTALGTIHDHGGAINLSSEKSKGTIFTICLPVVQVGQMEWQETAMETMRVESKKTVLVVEDDKQVRNTVIASLSNLGYQTIEACDGIDAWDKFLLHKHEIDLVLSDITMPKMGGIEVVLKMRQEKANMPVIFMTGYDSGKRIEKQFSQDDNTEIMTKPFAIASLSQLLAKLIP